MEQKLLQYKNLLIQWNKKINLIGDSTIDDFDNRHIKDSLQLLKFFNEKQLKESSFVDLGTGAGIPGLILSVAGVKHMTLVEKSIQKCNFLREAVKISDNYIKIINKNIYEIKNLKFDFIISRALANLTELLKMSKNFYKKNTKCIFLKGQKYQQELKTAQQQFKFDFELYDSETSKESKVLIISDIK